MNPTECGKTLLRTLASMPFSDRLDLVGISGWSRGAVYRSIRELEEAKLVMSVPHATDLLAPSRRYFLGTAGLNLLARDQGTTVEQLLRSRPVSAEWQRILLERLDAVAVTYRLATAVSDRVHLVRFHWYRALPMDACMGLPDGRVLAVVRQGLTASRTGFAKRMWKLRDMPQLSAVLVLLPDEVRLRHARRLLMGTQLPAFLALERDVAGAGGRWSHMAPSLRQRRPQPAPRPVPRGPARLDSGPTGALKGTASRRGPFADCRRSRAKPHAALGAEACRKAHPGHAVRLALDHPPRTWAVCWGYRPPGSPSCWSGSGSLGLVAHFVIDGRRRLALSDRGLALLARRDRTSVGLARKRWSVTPVAGAPLTWREVTGRSSRQLLRNLAHTESVHRFVATLSHEARLNGWDVAQLDPPRRAARHFRHGDGLRSIHPDAFGILRRGGTPCPFFLEWERRAVRPVTMAARLAPYLRYYSSPRPTDDHGVQPSVLVVFDDDVSETHFLRVAGEEMDRSGVSVPLMVSQRDVLERLGTLRTCMAQPGKLGIRIRVPRMLKLRFPFFQLL